MTERTPRTLDLNRDASSPPPPLRVERAAAAAAAATTTTTGLPSLDLQKSLDGNRPVTAMQLGKRQA